MLKKILSTIAVVLAVLLITFGWTRSASAADRPIPRCPAYVYTVVKHDNGHHGHHHKHHGKKHHHKHNHR